MSPMECRQIKYKDGASAGDDIESLGAKPPTVPIHNVATFGRASSDHSKWKRKSQAILIFWSKRAGNYEYSVTTANFLVETLKCALSLAALARNWKNDGVTKDNRLSTTLDEVIVYPIPTALYLVKNLLQYYILAFVDAPGYQILKNLNIISTGVLYQLMLKKKLSEIQWAAFILLCAGCTTAQSNPSDWIMAIVMALLSGFAGVYTEPIIKKHPSRNINVQNFWLYVFGMAFNAVAILIQDFDAVMNDGFFHGYSLITVLMILNHALSGLAVSMVMKYADNIVKVYSTSVAMLLTAVASVFLSGFHLSLAFFLGTMKCRFCLDVFALRCRMRTLTIPSKQVKQDGLGRKPINARSFGPHLISPGLSNIITHTEMYEMGNDMVTICYKTAERLGEHA